MEASNRVAIRRLDRNDTELLRAAYYWDANAPEWFRQMDNTFGWDSEDDFISLVDDPANAFIGIFNPELTGLITASLAGKGRYAVHLWAKRGTSLGVLEEAGYQIREQLVAFGAQEIFVWVAERNRHVKQLCARLGLLPDGIEMIKGCYKGKVIVWHRLTYVYNPPLVVEMVA